MPQIAVLNESTAISDADVQKMIPAFNQQWNNDLRPVWGVDDASFVFVPKNHMPSAGSWWLVFLDDSDQADALAYHDLTNEGLPISKVFVRTLLADHASVSVGASHQICEMAVDPWLNRAYQDDGGVFWACEVCDPVAGDQYGYDINGVLLTDFVTPRWFGHQRDLASHDFKGLARAPFEVLSGGYAQKFEPQQGWEQITGSEATATMGAGTISGSRRERRARQWTDRSAESWSQSFITRVDGVKDLPNVEIVTLPQSQSADGQSDMLQLMSYMSGNFKPLPDTLISAIGLDTYRDFLATLIRDADKRENYPGVSEKLYPYIDSIISNCVLPVKRNPVSGETLHSLVKAAGPSSAAFLAMMHPGANEVLLYFMLIGGTPIVVGVSNTISKALAQRLS